jgi:hypothetical protein
MGCRPSPQPVIRRAVILSLGLESAPTPRSFALFDQILLRKLLVAAPD